MDVVHLQITSSIQRISVVHDDTACAYIRQTVQRNNQPGIRGQRRAASLLGLPAGCQERRFLCLQHAIGLLACTKAADQLSGRLVVIAAWAALIERGRRS